MTTSTRLAIAPIVAFALSFAVVLALGQLVARPPGDGGGPTTPPSTPVTTNPVEPEPIPPADPTGGTSPDQQGGSATGTIELDATGRRYTFGPVDPGTRFEGAGLTASATAVDDDDVQVCVTSPPNTRIPAPGWRDAGRGLSCAVVHAGSTVHVHLMRTS
jgi:hypothetical protein